MFSIMDFFPRFAHLAGSKVPDDRPIDGVDQADLLLGNSDAGRREQLLSFVGPDLVAARWKQFRVYFADMAPGRSGRGGADLLAGTGASAAPMNGYPKVFNIESDPREEHNIGAMYEWVIGPALKAVEEYNALRRIRTYQPRTSPDFEWRQACDPVLVPESTAAICSRHSLRWLSFSRGPFPFRRLPKRPKRPMRCPHGTMALQSKRSWTS
jgi:hypothetical protein